MCPTPHKAQQQRSRHTALGFVNLVGRAIATPPGGARIRAGGRDTGQHPGALTLQPYEGAGVRQWMVGGVSKLRPLSSDNVKTIRLDTQYFRGTYQDDNCQLALLIARRSCNWYERRGVFPSTNAPPS